MSSSSSDNAFLKDASTGDISTLTLLYSPAAKETVDAEGKTALHVASSEGRLSTVEWLLEKGFNVDALNKKGEIKITGCQRLSNSYYDESPHPPPTSRPHHDIII